MEVKELTPLEKELKEQDLFIESQNPFIDSNDMFKVLNTYVNNYNEGILSHIDKDLDEGFLFLLGSHEGVGKTSLLANYVRELKSRTDCNVYARFYVFLI